MKAGSFLGLLQSPFGLLPQPQKTSGNYYLYALLVNDVVALFGVNDVMALENYHLLFTISHSLAFLVEEVVGRVRHIRLMTDVC